MSTARQPGLVVKLRPTGPWRVGPDSGARDGVDLLYHSDSLYSAVTGALRLLGTLDDWLEATARNPAGPAVRFSSLFPFQNEIGFVIPPRSVWPPPPSSKVRWKAARFIPLGLVAPLLGGRGPAEEQWDVDGASECLVPVGRTGPFRAGMRSAAAVDRLSGRVKPHSTACVEFLPGAGLWAVIAFTDERQNERWNAPVRAAFRLLADSGFGGERGRGWGHTEAPEFIDGSLPDMILPAAKPVAAAAPAPEALPAHEEEPAVSEAAQRATGTVAPLPSQASAGPDSEPVAPPSEADAAAGAESAEPDAAQPEPEPQEPNATFSAETLPATEVAQAAEPTPAPSEPAPALPDPAVAQLEPDAPLSAGALSLEIEAEPPVTIPAAPQTTPADSPAAYWLLSLFSPAEDDSIDWNRGSYTLVAREGRIQSPVRSGDLKRGVNMVSEGSVLVASIPVQGAAADVAPDDFAHPVYRAGFALAIPIPWQGAS